ncbi:TnsA endonuclease N-terminal domain-containing protein [Paenibacillus abyssi]|uniref:Transposase n=1 Tax=Paenibacillus abyssi TaxID=1340531 RepID=A0A917D2E7_9BACL|nr:TnsA endonuclease N-terminal domain-containing protein [Paenibacillus abyssi]GGG07665.1 hypothetical protein GCM10010916_25690 [Paenibacillus abyssi]
MKAGRGQETGKDYVPWTTVRDFSGNNSQSGRVPGWKTGRIHNFLSQFERHYFYMLEWSDNITDIREKYPLPIENTSDLSQRLGIKHPEDQKTKELIVMTTDFVINVNQNGNNEMVARTVIPANQLSSKRKIDKFELERMYWAERNVDWGIVTEHEIPKEMAQNIEWIYACRDIDGSPFHSSPTILAQLEPTLYSEVTNSYGFSLAEAALNVDKRTGMENGASLWAIQHFIATKQWIVDMTKRIHPSKPLFVERAAQNGIQHHKENVVS